MSERITAVLSGGGVKAAAHIGALRALSAAGLIPNRYVGTSMGAVIASGLAAGASHTEVEARLLAVRNREVFRIDRRALLMGMFARSLLRPEPFRVVLERLLPVASFAELILPLSITATDLDSGELLVFGAGGEEVPLLDALCASCALPLYFPPYLINGRRLADGGLRAVVPLEVAARFPADLVIAIDVSSGFDTLPAEADREPPALLRLHGEAQRALMASNTAAQHELWLRTPERPPLVWIRPRVRRGETFATEQLQWYIAEGERAAQEVLATRQT
ncbi:MAG TPA: patatin-like phospholipase family protein [Gemmatimonadales bacterium]|nr:patatin-like phospholipase family protein [Gemmatimonadales bacterium]